MNTHTADFAKKLEAEKTALIAQLQEYGRINPENTNDWEPVATDLNMAQSEIEDRATEITSFEDRSAIEFELEEKLKQVNAALEAITNDTYGKCTVCNNPIEYDRLDANPTAMTCKAHME